MLLHQTLGKLARMWLFGLLAAFKEQLEISRYQGVF
jgi:hypothetical protein